jgi:hypothetical protein
MDRWFAKKHIKKKKHVNSHRSSVSRLLVWLPRASWRITRTASLQLPLPGSFL